MPQASARRLPFGHPRICSQITGDSALQCWSGCEISPRVHHFYSRPCGRGDPDWPATGDFELLFLLTPLREGRRIVDNNVDVLAEFLLTPLREGRPIWLGKQYLGQKISTHAPAGGATAPTASAAPPRFHFYSRPCGRGDTNLSDKYVESLNFYSRPCGRGDYIVHHKRALTPISTHAPAGGATSRSRCCHRSPRYFYSRPCGRGDS